jgi:flagellar hook protein FlgE
MHRIAVTACLDARAKIVPMNSVAAISLAGLQSAAARLQASAQRVASDQNADLPKEVVEQKMAEHNFKANLIAMRTANEMTKQMLDILA